MKKWFLFIPISIFTLSFVWFHTHLNIGLENNSFSSDLPKFYTYDYLISNNYKMYYHDYIWYNKSVLVELVVNNQTFKDSVQLTLRTGSADFPLFSYFQIAVNSRQDSLLKSFLDKTYDKKDTTNSVDSFFIEIEEYKNHDKKYFVERIISDSDNSRVTYSFYPKKVYSSFYNFHIRLWQYLLA